MASYRISPAVPNNLASEPLHDRRVLNWESESIAIEEKSRSVADRSIVLLLHNLVHFGPGEAVYKQLDTQRRMS